MAADEMDHAIVVGGGPAGLMAGQWLARYQRRVRVVDAGDGRNAVTWGVHGYFGISDPSPAELRRIGQEQARGAGAVFEEGCVERIEGEKDDFTVTLADGRTLRTRRILLATGLKDIVPETPGLRDFYGQSIWHCPDCDGPEVVGKRVAVMGWGEGIAKFCMYILTWTRDIVLLTDSHAADMSTEALEALAHHGISIRREAVLRLEGEGDQVRRAILHEGPPEEIEAMFFHIASGPGSTLAADLGCKLDEDGALEGILDVDKNFQTSVPGVYAAGDIVPGSRLVIRAASEGARAALGIHKSLFGDDRRIG
ncbi:MAG TPA: NAD(P)/FAD-dependent oxidoreductase [Longimicrobium sp.]|jgi:thioredoxin reductase